MRRAFEENLPRVKPRVRFGAKATAANEPEAAEAPRVPVPNNNGNKARSHPAAAVHTAHAEHGAHAVHAAPPAMETRPPTASVGPTAESAVRPETRRSRLRSHANDETPQTTGNTEAALAAAEKVMKELVGAKATIARLETSLKTTQRDLERARAELLERDSSARRTPGVPVEKPREPGEDLAPSGILKHLVPTITGRSADLLSGTEAERATLRSILRDLDQGSTGIRFAALERLALMPPRLAAPVFGAVLSLEVEPKVLAHLCRVVGHCGVHSLLPLLGRHATHPDDQVRTAVRLAQQRLGGGEASDKPPATPAANQAEELPRIVYPQSTELLPEIAQSTPVARGGRLREIERELRQSLRGLTPDALLNALELSHGELNSALDLAISAGRIVRRGPRYFAS